VVPLVYIMVQKSSAAGGTGGAGCALPSARNSSYAYTLMLPSLLISWRHSTSKAHQNRHGNMTSHSIGEGPYSKAQLCEPWRQRHARKHEVSAWTWTNSLSADDRMLNIRPAFELPLGHDFGAAAPGHLGGGLVDIAPVHDRLDELQHVRPRMWQRR